MSLEPDREIEGMKARMQSMITALQTDVLKIEQEIDLLAIQVGHAAYKVYKDSGGEEDSIKTIFLTTLLSQMEELDKKVEEIRNKMTEITNQHNADVEALTRATPTQTQSQMPMPVYPSEPDPTPIPPAPQQLFCSECGTGYTHNHNFCEKCGSKLD